MKNEDYSQRIRKYRNEKNYTQEFMAHQLNINQNTYSIIESGKTKIKAEMLEKIAEILELPLINLLENKKKESSPPLKNSNINIGGESEEKLLQERLLWRALDKARIETIETQKKLIEILQKL